MRFLLLLSIILSSHSLLGFEVSASWNNKFERLINVSCSSNEEYLCADLCQQYNQCQVKENYCGNCTGDNLFLRHFFKEIGESISNQQKPMAKEQFIEILREGNFVTLDAKSIFNFVDKFNSLEIRDRFRSLCSSVSEAPIAFIGVHPYSRTPDKILAVACTDVTRQTEVFHLERIYQLESN